MKPTRLLLLGAMLTLLAATSRIPALAETCQKKCIDSDNQCISGCNPDGNPNFQKCHLMCQEAFSLCLSRCTT